MTADVEPLLDLLGRLGDQVRLEGLAAADGLGDRTLTMKDDVHIAPSDHRLSAIALHRRRDPDRIEVSLHLGAVGDEEREELDAVLGEGEELPRPPDAIGQRFVEYRPHGHDLGDVDPSWIARRDPRDRVIVLSIEVAIVR